MKERVLTSFYPKIKKDRLKQKVKSMSKLDLSEKIKNKNSDYFDILLQIKSKKKKLAKNNNLSLYFIQPNNNKNDIRNKLINQKRQIALITEPNYERKNISYKKISKNYTFSKDKNECYFRQKYTTPKKLISTIIKFQKDKKAVKKVKLMKKREPIELSYHYRDYIEKIKRFNFFKYSNSNVNYAHNLRTSLYVNTVNESLKQEKKRKEKYMEKEKERIESEKESRDIISYPSLDFEKITRQVKLILGNENKFNQTENKEKFFHNLPNRVNFLYDNFKPPNIKNNLTKITFSDLNNDKKLNLYNRIGNSAINYLSIAKEKMQREKDEKIKFLSEKNKITKKYKYYKKLSSNINYNSREEIEKMIYKNYYIKNEEDFEPKNKTLEQDEMLEQKGYFEDKLGKYDKIGIAEPRLRKFYFDNINAKINIDKNSEKKLIL